MSGADPKGPLPLADDPSSPVRALLRPVRELEVSAAPGSRERVWRALQEPSRASRRWAFGLGLAATAAALVLVALKVGALAPAPPDGRTAVVALAAQKVERGGAALAAGDALVPGESLATGADGQALVRLDGAHVLLGPSTLVRWPGARGAEELVLERGAVTLSVRPRPKDRPLAVLAGGYRVQVVGTLFSVRLLQPGQVEVAVEEGVVRVSGPGAEAVLRAGEGWSSVRSRSPANVATGEVALLRGLPGASQEGTLRVEAAPGVRVRVDGLEVGGAPASLRLPAGEHLVSGSTGGQLRVSVVPQGSALAALDSPSPEALRQQAQARLAAKDPAGAAERYRLLVEAGGPSAELALYELGRLMLRELGDPQEAARAFDEYARRFPKGALRPEVDLSGLEAQLALGDAPEALGRADAFLEQHPDSERRSEVSFIRGNLRRDRGDCEGALADYGAVEGRLEDDARFFGAGCLAQLGRSAAARERLEAYLRDFPVGRHRREAHEALSRP